MADGPPPVAAPDVLRHAFGWRWTAGFAVALGLVLLLLYSSTLLFAIGVGLWGTNVPIVWAFDIINYVWWIGIANAASLFATTLVLRDAQWRTSLNRFAEAVALFAAICAGLFPIVHLGRPWLFYWVFPYPATYDVWPQFRSPLVWDFFAIMTHIVLSLLFSWLGLIPDLAKLRDSAATLREQRIFAVLAVGWRGSARHWRRHRTAYRLLAGLIVPLVVVMQSTVALEFAVTLVPAWHQARLPAYFIVSGLMSGLAMVLLVALLLRSLLDLHRFLTRHHLDMLSKLLLASGIVMAYAFAHEAFMSWYSGSPDQRLVLAGRLTGIFSPVSWAAILCTAGASQLLWFPAVRRSTPALLAIAVVINIGIWLDRFTVVVTGIHRDYLPSAWGTHTPTVHEWALLAGTAGLFVFLMLLFVRFLPVISVFEIQAHGTATGDRG